MNNRLTFWSVIIGIVSGLIAIIAFIAGGVGGAANWFSSRGEVELPATYPGESWRPAAAADYQWLVADWCYPTLPDFRTSFRMENGAPQRRNFGVNPPTDTGWMDVKVYKSNRDLIRIWHERENMPGAYFRPAASHRLSAYENDRMENDAGTVSDGERFLLLNCARCQISSDGIIYECE